MRIGMIVYAFGLTVMVCETLILTDERISNVDRDSSVSSHKRVKRGWVKDSAELLVKGGKYANTIWRYYKARRVLLKDANFVYSAYHLKVYVKAGGKDRADNDFYLTLPDKEMDSVDTKLGVIGNRRILMSCNQKLHNSETFKRLYDALVDESKLYEIPKCVIRSQQIAPEVSKIMIFYI